MRKKPKLNPKLKSQLLKNCIPLDPHIFQASYTDPIPIVLYVEVPTMVHTYEVLVDIKEYPGQSASTCHNATSRYEIDAESKHSADVMARAQARSEHPNGTEFDSRVTRLLR